MDSEEGREVPESRESVIDFHGSQYEGLIRLCVGGYLRLGPNSGACEYQHSLSGMGLHLLCEGRWMGGRERGRGREGGGGRERDEGRGRKGGREREGGEREGGAEGVRRGERASEKRDE